MEADILSGLVFFNETKIKQYSRNNSYYSTQDL
jgi:hypothetical protein